MRMGMCCNYQWPPDVDEKHADCLLAWTVTNSGASLPITLNTSLLPPLVHAGL